MADDIEYQRDVQQILAEFSQADGGLSMMITDEPCEEANDPWL